MVQPTFSIIIPVYNVEKYLEQCIKSVLNQTYKNFEVILVDDGSIDNSLSICNQFLEKDERVKVFHIENLGAANARNFGMEKASAKYLFFLDSDDYVDSTLLEDCLNIFENNNYDAICFGYELFCQDKVLFSQELNLSKSCYLQDEIRNDLIPKMIFLRDNEESNHLHFNRMFIVNSEVIKKNNWKFDSEKEILSEDVVSLIDLFYNFSSIGILKHQYYHYRRHNQSYTNTYKPLQYQQLNNMISLLLEKDKKNYMNKYFDRFINLYFSYLIAMNKLTIKSKLKLKEKLNVIKKISKNELLTEIIDNYNYFNSIIKRIYFWAIRNNKYVLVYFMTYIKR